MSSQSRARPADAWRVMDQTLEEMIAAQREKVLRIGREYAPDATPEDLLNPHDLPALQCAPQFHFEDGILSGYLSAQMALRASEPKPAGEPESETS